MATVNQRLDQAFPNAGGFDHLTKLWGSMVEEFSPTVKHEGNTMFYVAEAEHIVKIFELLENDEPARAVLASIIVFAQKKSDCAGR